MNEEEIISDEVLEDIKKHFKFLYDRGYEVDSARTISKEYAAWEVILKHQDHFVKFSVEKGGLDLLFGSPSKGYIGIRSLIYFLSDERDFIGFNLLDIFRGMKKEASLLQQHIDEFESCFGSDFPKYEEGLKSADQRYFDRVGLNIGDVESTQASKKNPILSVIILFPVFLIAYALIIGMITSTLTLGLDGEIVLAIIWVASLLLAAGTVYLFNKRQ